MNTRTTSLISVSLAVSAMNVGFLVSGYMLSVLCVILDGIVSIVLLCLLSIVSMPMILRAILIPAVLISYLAVSTGTDMFGVTRSKQSIADQDAFKAPLQGPAKISPWASAGVAPEVHQASGTQGASVSFDGVHDEGHWAKRLNTALDHQIGGNEASAISIRGVISSATGSTESTIVMIWSIKLGGTTEHCGRSSIVGSNEEVLLDQIQQPVQRAVERTIVAGQPVCY